MYITICEIGHQSKFDGWNRSLKPGALDNPGEWDGEGGGRGAQDGWHMYIHGWFMTMYDKIQHNIVK